MATMVIPIREKFSSMKRSDLGEYLPLKKQLELWFNGAKNMVASDPVVIPEFDFPIGVEKLILRDTSNDMRLDVPVDVFQSTFLDGRGYVFDLKDWAGKYKVQALH